MTGTTNRTPTAPRPPGRRTLAPTAFGSPIPGMGKRIRTDRLIGWLAVGAIACSAAATLGGCARAAERQQYLISRETAVQPRTAASTDRPVGVFAGVTDY